MFLASSVARKMDTVICFGSVPSHLYCMFGGFLSVLILCLRIVASGLVACADMVGCLVSVANGGQGSLDCVFWSAGLSWSLRRCIRVLIWRISSGHWTPPDYWDGDDVALAGVGSSNIWTDGSR